MAENPLTQQDRERVEDMIARLNEADDLIRRSKQAGFDVTAEEAESKKSRAQLVKIRGAFFPTGS